MSALSKTRLVIVVFVATVLAACGGGGGGTTNQSSTLSLTGVAATGLAIPSASVNAKCQTGTGTATTTASGAYTLSVSGGALPCMLEVTNPADGTKIHSVATGSGTSAVANLTPLTELVTSRLLGQDAAVYFAGLSAANLATKVTTAAISAAQTDVVAALGGTVDTTAISNFISTPMVAATAASPSTGDAQDKVLDALRTKLTPTQIAQVASLLVVLPQKPVPLSHFLIVEGRACWKPRFSATVRQGRALVFVTVERPTGKPSSCRPPNL